MIKTHLDHWFIVWIILMQMLKVLEKKKNHADYTVGWSDLALFLDFRKPTHFCWSSIFLGTQFPKIGSFSLASTLHARESLHFLKNQSDLKNWYFFWKFTKTFLMHQRTIDIKKIWNFLYSMIFYFTKMVKTQNCFWSIQGQNKYFFEYLFIFSPIKNQRIPSPHLRLQKGFKFFFLADFKVKVLNLLRPCDQGKRQH